MEMKWKQEWNEHEITMKWKWNWNENGKMKRPWVLHRSVFLPGSQHRRLSVVVPRTNLKGYIYIYIYIMKWKRESWNENEKEMKTKMKWKRKGNDNLWLGNAIPSRDTCTCGPGCCSRRASNPSLEDSELVALSRTLAYNAEWAHLVSSTCNILQILQMCRRTGSMWKLLHDLLSRGQYRRPEMFIGSACK